MVLTKKTTCKTSKKIGTTACWHLFNSHLSMDSLMSLRSRPSNLTSMKILEKWCYIHNFKTRIGVPSYLSRRMDHYENVATTRDSIDKPFRNQHPLHLIHNSLMSLRSRPSDLTLMKILEKWWYIHNFKSRIRVSSYLSRRMDLYEYVTTTGDYWQAIWNQHPRHLVHKFLNNLPWWCPQSSPHQVWRQQEDCVPHIVWAFQVHGHVFQSKGSQQTCPFMLPLRGSP